MAYELGEVEEEAVRPPLGLAGLVVGVAAALVVGVAAALVVGVAAALVVGVAAGLVVGVAAGLVGLTLGAVVVVVSSGGWSAFWALCSLAT
jgi:hypothetical protein